MEREYGRHVSPTDLNSEERERYSHFRWTNLEKPEEIWKEKIATGDHRYTLISQFTPDSKPIWGVGVCLMLRGDPSFLFIAFVTSDRHLVDVFRKGEKQKVVQKNVSESAPEKKLQLVEQDDGQDGLAEPWTESDSVRASIVGSRKPNDIPIEDFCFYQKCLEETLQQPTELWSYTAKSSTIPTTGMW